MLGCLIFSAEAEAARANRGQSDCCLFSCSRHSRVRVWELATVAV